MRYRRWPIRPIIWLLLAGLLVGGARGPIAAAERNTSFLAAMESITAGELQGHVDYLADDALEGRLPGTRGGRTAGEYLAKQLAELRLRPGGIDGGYFQPFDRGYRNVLAILPGSDPQLRQQVVILGAHYDHVGYGTSRNSRGPIGYIHNGADDNASGTSALLEVAQAFTMLPEPPKRTLLFAFWDAEEKGMLGSKHWLAQPTLPREDLAAMLCMDMVGRLRNDRLKVFGSRSGCGLRRLVSGQNDGLGLVLDFDWSLRNNSDHFPFYRDGLPVLLLHTGLHEEYHRPSDDAKLIDAGGMNRVTRLMFGIAHELANVRRMPVYRKSAAAETPDILAQILQRQPVPPGRLGVSWSPDEPVRRGVRVTDVADGSPAARAGIEPGDRIVRLAGRPIRSGDDLSGAVMAARNPVVLIIERPGEEKPKEVTARLAGKPMRLGILWRIDDAEPGTLILTHVTDGSPAARAGLEPGDRIHRAAGRGFADDDQFLKIIATTTDSLPLLVERAGRLRTVVLHFQQPPARRAA